MTGLKLDPADAQAIRWFYTINALDQSGYKGAKTNETISEYTRRGLKTLLGGDIQSGKARFSLLAGLNKILALLRILESLHGTFPHFGYQLQEVF